MSTLNVSKALAILGALRALDGTREVVGGEIVSKPYTFGDGPVRLHIAMNIRRLEELHADTEKARVALVKEIFGDEQPAQDHPGMATFQRRYQEMLETTSINSDDLKHLDFMALKVDENRIPATVLAALLPIIMTPQDSGAA